MATGDGMRAVVFPARFRNAPDEIELIESAFHRIWTATGQDRNEVICQVFLEGLRALTGKLSQDGKLNLQTAKIYERLVVEREGRAFKMALVALYEQISLDEFAKFCGDNGIDYQEFLEDMRYSIAKRVGTSHMGKWLDALMKDGLDHPIEEIREVAERDKVVTVDADWKQMKVIASQRGYSGMDHRGTWRLRQAE